MRKGKSCLGCEYADPKNFREVFCRIKNEVVEPQDGCELPATREKARKEACPPGCGCYLCGGCG